MNKYFFSSAVIAAFVLTACGGNPPVYNEPTTSQPVVLPSTSPVAAATDSNLGTPVTVNAATTVNPVPVTQAIPAQPAPTTAKASAGVNPAHGQPGHRCDIPVGAPLNSPAASTQNQVQQIQPVGSQQPVGPQIMPIEPAKPASGTARLNPAHGQPGHDCAVPVGAPLKQ